MDKCNECNQDITDKELDYSEKKYMRPLCRICQKDSNVFKGTSQQHKICSALRLAGYRAYAEWFDGVKHIDIAIPDAMFHIEVDGKQHYDSEQALKDLGRTYYSFEDGYFTLRVPNSLVDNDFNKTVSYIVDFIKKSHDQLITLSNLEQTPSARIFSGTKTPSYEVIQEAYEFLSEHTIWGDMHQGSMFYDKSTNRVLVSYLGEWPTDDQAAIRNILLDNFGIDIDFNEM